MLKSPEQFDFSKLEDQQKLDKLSKDKQDGIINKSQEEAQKINEEIKKKEITPDDWIHSAEGTRSACWHKLEKRCGDLSN